MARATKADAQSVPAETGEVREDTAVETAADQPAPLVAVAAGETATNPAGQSVPEVTVDVKPQGDVDPSQGQGPAVADVAAAASVLADSASKAASPAFDPTADDDEVPDEGDVELVMALTISGLRNGEPWPRAGRTVTVPAAEAASLVANGYTYPAE
ncbi:hypothetical protein FHS07_001893 [Microbacterium proteolyticum]|uniref:Uncharacterized protein n=1 Tax=Microbacterium proteolyticum TaxID=1572644 RepID=A0A7W5CIB2_9MICO|nr:hypothetical protein [Microbacterium proteolyticum]MBB3158197.1 hypothetical protein [Microbacterium proteolyticum]